MGFVRTQRNSPNDSPNALFLPANGKQWPFTGILYAGANDFFSGIWKLPANQKRCTYSEYKVRIISSPFPRCNYKLNRRVSDPWRFLWECVHSVNFTPRAMCANSMSELPLPAENCLAWPRMNQNYSMYT